MASCVAYVYIALVLGFTPIIKQGKSVLPIRLATCKKNDEFQENC